MLLDKKPANKFYHCFVFVLYYVFDKILSLFFVCVPIVPSGVRSVLPRPRREWVSDVEASGRRRSCRVLAGDAGYPWEWLQEKDADDAAYGSEQHFQALLHFAHGRFSGAHAAGENFLSSESFQIIIELVLADSFRKLLSDVSFLSDVSGFDFCICIWLVMMHLFRLAVFTFL